MSVRRARFTPRPEVCHTSAALSHCSSDGHDDGDTEEIRGLVQDETDEDSEEIQKREIRYQMLPLNVSANCRFIKLVQITCNI